MKRVNCRKCIFYYEDKNKKPYCVLYGPLNKVFKRRCKDFTPI